MSISRLHRFCLVWTTGLALGAAFVVPAQAAKPVKETKESREAQDGGPVLMSRTGGGGWSNLKELQQAAAKGNPKAEAQLGELLLRGEGIAKDEPGAVRLLEKAARAGQSSAAFRVGMLLARGESGVAKDPDRALAYFRAAAAGGEKEAFFNIGAAYASARGVKRDYGEALGWLIVARQHGADASGETSLRAQIKAQPAWIARGERRAQEIAQEFAGKKVVDYLPPAAPLEFVAEPPKPADAPNPAAPLKPAVDPLKPVAGPRPADALKPGDLLKPIEPPKPVFVLPTTP